MMPLNANPEFTVATIKPSNPNAPRGGYGFRGQDVTTTNVTVNWMIKLATTCTPPDHRGTGVARFREVRFGRTAGYSGPAQPGPDEADDSEIAGRSLSTQVPHRKEGTAGLCDGRAKDGSKLTESAGDPNAFPGIGFGQGPGVLSLVGQNTTLDGVANGLQSNVLTSRS